MTPTRPVATRQEILFQSLRSLMTGSRHLSWKSSLRINHARSLVWCQSSSVFGEVQPKAAIVIISGDKMTLLHMLKCNVQTENQTKITVMSSTRFQHSPSISSMESFSAEWPAVSLFLGSKGLMKIINAQMELNHAQAILQRKTQSVTLQKSTQHHALSQTFK